MINALKLGLLFTTQLAMATKVKSIVLDMDPLSSSDGGKEPISAASGMPIVFKVLASPCMPLWFHSALRKDGKA